MALSITLPAYSEFRHVPLGAVQTCDVSLRSSLDIPYQCQRWVDSTAKLPLWQDFLGFQFGQISHADWLQLSQTYGNWHNTQLLPPYDPQRNYELLDFMPPVIQALDKHRFYSERVSNNRISSERVSSEQVYNEQVSSQQISRKPTGEGMPEVGGLGSGDSGVAQWITNCWGTVYEILRLAKGARVESPVLFATAAEPMLKMLRNASAPVSSVQPGDILLISHYHGDREYLDHTVIVIDQGLYFEKAGAGDEVPYRFVDEATLRRIWNPTVFTYQARRPHPALRLPQPHESFSLKSLALPKNLATHPLARQRSPSPFLAHLTVIETPEAPPTFLWMQAIPPLRQIQGRFQLPQSAYRRIFVP